MKYRTLQGFQGIRLYYSNCPVLQETAHLTKKEARLDILREVIRLYFGRLPPSLEDFPLVDKVIESLFEAPLPTICKSLHNLEKSTVCYSVVGGSFE